MSEIDGFEHPSVILCPGGPMLIRGPLTLQTLDRTTHHTDGPISAVCRCAKSSDLPWCDGTHKRLPEDLTP